MRLLNNNRILGNTRVEEYFIFILFCIIYIAFSYYVVFHLKFVIGDAVSRTEKAFMVVYGNQPKLASIGFIWTPLPSILQIPIILLVKSSAIYGFAGCIVSAMFGALSVVYIYRFLNQARIGYICKLLFLAVFGLNPMMLYYSANGMSESMLIFFLVISTWYLIQWIEFERVSDAILLGIMMSLAFFTRYEAVPFALLVGLLMLIQYYHKPSTGFSKTEGTIILTFVPVLFSYIIWLAANWTIMGDPFYFFRGQYSNTNQDQLLSTTILQMKHHLLLSIEYSVKRMAILFPLYFPIASVALLFGIKNRVRQVIYVVLLSLVVPIFELLMIVNGSSFGWLRFYIYVIPFAFIILAVLLKHYNLAKTTVVVIAIFSILSSVGTIYAMRNSEYGIEEHQFFRAYEGNVSESYTYNKDIEIVNYINTNINGGKILIDDFTGFGIIMYSLKPQLFVSNSDDNFAESLKNPSKYCDYVLVRNPNGLGALDAINRQYPGIFENGSAFTSLKKDFGYWKLYTINQAGI